VLKNKQIDYRKKIELPSYLKYSTGVEKEHSDKRSMAEFTNFLNFYFLLK